MGGSRGGELGNGATGGGVAGGGLSGGDVGGVSGGGLSGGEPGGGSIGGGGEACVSPNTCVSCRPYSGVRPGAEVEVDGKPSNALRNVCGAAGKGDSSTSGALMARSPSPEARARNFWPVDRLSTMCLEDLGGRAAGENVTYAA